MKRILTVLILAFVLMMITGTPALAHETPRLKSNAPESITVIPGNIPAVNFDGPGDDLPPPQITIETPQGERQPTL